MTTMDKRLLEDLDWAEEHHSELLRKYRDQWIAVYNKDVVAAGELGTEVEKRALAKLGKEHPALYYVDSGSSIYAG